MSSRPRATGDRHDLVLVARGEGKLREIGDRLEALIHEYELAA